MAYHPQSSPVSCNSFRSHTSTNNDVGHLPQTPSDFPSALPTTCQVTAPTSICRPPSRTSSPSLSFLATSYSFDPSKETVTILLIHRNLHVATLILHPVKPTTSRQAISPTFLLPEALGKGTYQIDYVPAPRITEADRTNDRKSLKRALDRRLYLLLYGSTYGTQAEKWHFPEKVYESESTMRLCAESALKSVLGGLDHTYFVGNAPFAHMTIEPTKTSPDSLFFKRFFFKSQVIGATKLNIGNCEDHVWVTKDELMDYFPEQAEFLNKMIIS